MTPPPRHVESNAWLFAKHAAQLGLVAAVAFFVLRGGESPMLTLAVAASALVALVTVAIVDRRCFEDSGIEHVEHVVVDVVGPAMWVSTPMATPVAPAQSWFSPRPGTPLVADVASSVAGLAPLVADMSIALDEPVDVT